LPGCELRYGGKEGEGNRRLAGGELTDIINVSLMISYNILEIEMILIYEVFF
jgi:hypothetical protein